MQTRIDIIRHGEPEGGNVFRGRTDHALTALGQWQFDQRVARHRSAWQRVISSPLQRCRQSAQTLAQQLQIPLHIDERWAEIDYGDWENQPVDSIMHDPAQDARALWEDPLNFCAPQGEPVTALQQRVLAAWDSALSEHAGEHLLVVCHGGVMRVLAQHLLQLAPQAMNRLAVPYAGLLRFRIDHSEYQGKPQQWITLEHLDGNDLTP
ncbi:histidine phosphatase family protein [Venatoribacter cucullus]|uniref:histidine phosphatase family protein n=1 Tax=Venatoribacter cucullus TaxID=2661630 RepID=UPI00223EB343|nr:histidine phosphatase family protein [Venatoribacter cucullus]UZK02952.1 histidine phosphatase family protein [Venatoribacter cucullus]